MSEWRMGEPPEEGWYAVLNQDEAVTLGYYEVDAGWTPAEPYTELGDETYWHDAGPIRLPEPPEWLNG